MKKYLLCIILLLFSVFSIHADFTLIHKTHAPFGLLENGQQATHTETHIVYANPGDTLRMYRPERMAFTGYIRWYCYDTDSAANGIIHDGYTVSAWEDKFTISNERGLFKRKWGKTGSTNRQSADSTEYYEVDYIMHSGNSIYRIAVDESIYWDYEPDNDWRAKKITALIEPTLSKRIIYEMHPAYEIARKIDTCVGNVFLETHEIIAPVGRQLYVGPNYRFRCKNEGQQIYRWTSHSNYYYNESNPIQMYNKDNWEWYIDGVKSNLEMEASQYIKVSCLSPGTHTYTLKYNAGGIYYNIAKFRITYFDTNIVGPVENLPLPTNVNMIYENTFNYNEPGVITMAVWDGHFDVDESTYGYYFKNLSTYRDHHNDEPNWCEYGVVNAQDIWASSGTRPWIYNHVDGLKNLQDNAKKGYMIFVDGSQQPGEVFSLKVNANLCPGSKMYFSAWLIDASPKDNSKCAPNMDFIVIGVDNNQEEHILTTFTTGEFGCNALENVNNKNKKMNNGTWYQIMFPVDINASEIYQIYKLKIANKGKSADGNDFAIDDIRIYVQNPPVNPIQASTYDCPTSTIDSITTYLRVDYQSIDATCDKFYYQWTDFNKNPLKLNYFNSIDSIYGFVNVPKTDEAIIASGDTCLSLLSFDAQYFNTEVPIVKYIKERVDFETERYFMYIAQPMVVRTNYNYTGHVAVRPQDLGHETQCGTKADLLVAGGTRILINGESLGDSVVDVCGNRSYTLDIVLTYIAKDTLGSDELKEYTTPCKADWLVGDSSYVNNNTDIYKYTFKQIEHAVEDYRTTNPEPLSKTIVQYLLKQNLLVLNKKSTIIEPSRSLSYTAFPVNGSADNQMSVCLTPRFLYLDAFDDIVNMMKVGADGEVLPEVVIDRPRIVRISNTQKVSGYFDLPLYLAGDSAERYVIDSIHIISSTAPIYPLIQLNSNKDTINTIDIVTLSSDDLSLLDAGYDYTFHVAFIGESEEDQCNRGYTYFTLRIVPDIVTWYGGAWNDDNNWDTYIPMKETNVLLTPIDYNVLFDDESIAKYDINYIENECNDIYLPDSASMYGQELININGKAFIDIKEYAWKWTLTSIPIKGVVSGDLFISANESTEPFIVASINQIPGDIAYDRTTWKLYRKVFDVNTNKWQYSTNSLVDKIKQGSTDMIGVDCEKETDTIIIRLPKQDTIYHYYSSNTWVNENEHIIRNKEYGKPIWNGDTIITLKEPYNHVYLFGNPTFGYIDITKLIEDNGDKFTGRYYFEKYGASKIPMKTEDIIFNGKIDTLKTNLLLPPHRGILLEGNYESDSIIINLTKNHINPKGSIPKRRTYNNDNNIATSVDYINTEESYIIYDIIGRRIGLNFNELPCGIYILRNGKNTYKVLIER
jgi:hypothetical protein